MSDLSNALQHLLAFLNEASPAPPTRGTLILELRSPVALDDEGRLRVTRDELRVPADYESRFATLMASGFPWINVSCYGALDDQLIVVIELPRAPSDAKRTSVNYSGPSNRVRDSRWDASCDLAFDD